MKFIHAGLHVAAFLCAVIALVAAFDFHNAAKIPNMYSLHSWIGLTAVILYGLQVNTHFVNKKERNTLIIYSEFIFQVVDIFQHFLVVWTALAHHSEYQSSRVKYLKLFLPLSLNEQLVLGVGLYLIPVTPVSWRAACMPIHVYSGLLLFTTVIAVALLGITEKLIFGL